MTDQQKSFMLKAISLSREGMHAGLGGPFGCVIVLQGEIVGKGNNRVLTDNDPTAHAEIVAIREACKHLRSFQLSDCEIYSSCEPCPMCLGAIYWARPARVFYANTKKDAAKAGFDDDFIYQELEVPQEKRKIPMRHFHMDEAGKVFQDWIDSDKKLIY